MEEKKKNVTIVFDRKKRCAKTGKGKVEIVIYFRHNSRKYIVVGEGTPANWETVAQSVVVQDKVREYELILTAMRGLGEEITAENFNKYYEKKTMKKILHQTTSIYNGYDQGLSFIEYMKSCIAKEHIRKGTRDHKMVVVRAVHNFGKLDRFCDLTVPNLLAFHDWLMDKGDKTENTIFGYHKKIKKYVNKLYVAGMIPLNPYAQVKFPKGKCAERRPLSEDELVKIRETHLSGKTEKARDLFIFAAYTGLSHCDTQIFDFKTMTEKVGDLYYIDGSRIKTGANFFTPILKPAMEILKKYDYKVPHISDQKANDYLHLLEEQLGINKPITFHVARHSFATMVLSHDVPIENLARMLGHTDIRTTQVYAKILKSTIERHSEDLSNNIK